MPRVFLFYSLSALVHTNHRFCKPNRPSLAYEDVISIWVFTLTIACACANRLVRLIRTPVMLCLAVYAIESMDA